MKRPAVVIVACAAVAAVGGLAWWLTRDSEVAETRGTAGPASPLAPGAGPETLPAAGTIRPRRSEASDEPTAPETALEAALDPTHLYVAGKVIDERRRAMPAASIELLVEGRTPLRGKTGKDGRFRIDVGTKPDSLPRGAVEAADEKGRVALVSLPSRTPWTPDPLVGNVMDVGTLSLAEAGPVVLRVVKDGAGVPGARIYFGKAQSLGFGPFVTDSQGVLAGRRFPAGSHVVTAFSGDLDFRGEARLEIPRRGGEPLEVSLSPAWRLTVTVKDASTGKGVPGQELTLTSLVDTDARSRTTFGVTIPDPPGPTDADGRSVVAGLSPERPVTVDLAGPAGSRGLMHFDGSVRGHAKPGTEEVVITVGEGGETFTFPIVADETDGPTDGAEVRLSVPEGYGGAPPPTHGKVAGRSLVIDGVTKGCINILATADDGSRAVIRILGDARQTKIGSEAKFKRPRTLLVTAHDRKGIPLTGQLVQCRDPGNNPAGPSVPIGADGTARIEGLWPRKLDVSIRRPGDGPFGGKQAGSVDLTKPGDGRVDLILDAERQCLLRVTVDGAKRLPTTFSVRIQGDRGMSMGDVGPIEEDPDEGLLRFGVRPDPKLESLKLSVSGKGCPPVIVTLAIPKDDSVLESAVAFVTGAKVRIHVLPPSDNIHNVGLESWYAERSAWGPRGPHRPDQDELGKKPTEIVVDTLPTGKYRARDALTGVVSEPVEVAAGGSAEVTLDLSRAGPITGRVEGPTDAGLEAASVVIEGDGVVGGDDMPFMSRGLQVRLNSEFKARVPGDRPVTLRVKHSLLMPAADAGSATVTAPGASVVLKLVRGAEARFRVEGQADPREERGLPGQSRILMFAGKPEGEPAYTCPVTREEGASRIGGYKPGKYTLWCDLSRTAAPLVMEDITLIDGLTDLGDLKLPEGATVRLKIVTREGQEVPRVDVSATPIEKPSYWRSGSSRGTAEVLLKGLGPGKFKVDVRAGDFRAAPTTYEVVSTGTGEIPLTHDVR